VGLGSGLVGLAVAPVLGLAVSRWLILTCGVGCALWALLLGRPSRQPHRSGFFWSALSGDRKGRC
jgi:hypothetical protein